MGAVVALCCSGMHTINHVCCIVLCAVHRWASIALVNVATRLVALPVMLASQRSSARLMVSSEAYTRSCYRTALVEVRPAGYTASLDSTHTARWLVRLSKAIIQSFGAFGFALS